MDKKTIHKLSKKLLNSSISKKEFKRLNDWYHSFNDSSVEVKSDKTSGEVRQKMLNNILDETRLNEKKPDWPILKLVASLVLVAIIGIGVFLLTGSEESNPQNEMVSRPFQLKETKPGQKLTTFLPDGSKVILNSQSKISFSITERERKVVLEGEAFFEVKRDENRPFVVRTDNLYTKVLGTSFNVKAQPGENITVTVATGKVKVDNSSSLNASQLLESENSEDRGVVLIPGHQAVYNPGQGTIRSHEVNTEDFILWKDGILNFESSSLMEVITRLERWYGVSIEVIGKPSEPWNIKGEFDNKSLEFVLDALSYSQGFTFEILQETNEVKMNL